MTISFGRVGGFRRALCVVLAATIAVSPSLSAIAQTNAAAMAVRQRVEGLQPGPEGQPPAESPEGPAASTGTSPTGPVPAGVSTGAVDTRFISPDSAVILIARPAQVLATPLIQVFPVEVASAAGTKYLGFDPAQMEEIVACCGPFTPVGVTYCAAFKFKDPIRASSIPAESRSHAQLAELGGKKYLKSSVPTSPSFYGPNNKTLVLATDSLLQQLVKSAGQPKTGLMIERLSSVPPGSDLYLSADLASFMPFVQLWQASLPPNFKSLLETLKLASGFEFTLNISHPGPTSLVVHCNDEAAAQKFESNLQEAIQKLRGAQQPASDDVVGQAMGRFIDRMVQLIQPQRNGTSVNCLRLDGQNPTQHEIAKLIVASLANLVTVIGLKQAAQSGPQSAPGGPVQPPVGEQPPTAPAGPVHP